MRHGGWVADRVTEFEQLRGWRISSWTCTEMALREDVGGEPRFEDAAAPFLQLLSLGVALGDGTCRTVSAYQGDDAWGLWLNQGSAAAVEGGIFRARELPELPTGVVDEVSTVVDDDLLAEVVLRVEGRPLLLMAGEVYERMDGGLDFVRLDESVLVFSDPAVAGSVDWVPARRSLPRPG